MSTKKIIFIGLLVLLISISAIIFFAWRFGDWRGSVVSKISDEVVNQTVKDPLEKTLLQGALGFGEPRTYLILFLNNTELRPGGGFIGAYALLKIEKGLPSLIKVEGTEILDNQGKKDFESVPPPPISKYLKVSRWYFRDSNWSPDFSLSAQKAVELFLKQGGAGSIEKIDGVIGFTPTLIEEILKIHGPIKVGQEEFNSQNFTEKLEYEVEYGYSDRGLEFADRKDMLKVLANAMLTSLRFDVILNWSDYYDLSQQLLKQKQIVLYSHNPEEESFLSNKDWSGKMKITDSDYLLWVDANLGALKTDHAIKRELSYSIKPVGEKFLATVKMKFIHQGVFDWRTSRYRDYARVFVPIGSEFVKGSGMMEIEKSTKIGSVDKGIENNKQWFGAFIAVEPGKTGELSFEYYLPENIVKQIKNGNYKLLTQKQIGTIDTKLTLGLDFGKKLSSAYPGEEPKKHGDSRFDLITDLKEDREFVVNLEK